MSDTATRRGGSTGQRTRDALGFEDATYKGEGRVGPLAATQIHHLDFRVVQEFMAAALIAIPAEFEHIGAV